jgi:hypothetical protein
VIAWIALAVSLGSFGVSALAYRRVATGDRSADLVPFVRIESVYEPTGATVDYVNLGIENRGQHDATGVEIEVEFLKAGGQVDAKGELEGITSRTRYAKAINWQRRANLEPPLRVRLTWTDGRRGRQERIIPVSDYEGA